ncbi:transposase family protein [Spiroplasma endosymbiont of Polydrusus pterygomalis]|uniref:transposase family protein n=1 Tax=Spiroplasma endosymbiont of Polydrusus pterygomalis TaxID=3139327 RepID=UPI003CCB1E10
MLFQKKEKKHTIKTQIIIEKESKTIIATNFACGKTDDFRLFKESKIPLLKASKVIVDTRGYQGLQKVHRNVLIPHKKTKQKPLNNTQNSLI